MQRMSGDTPSLRHLRAIMTLMMGALAMLRAAVALAMCLVMAIVAPEGGGVDFRLAYLMVSLAVLILVDVAALQAGRRQD